MNRLSPAVPAVMVPSPNRAPGDPLDHPGEVFARRGLLIAVSFLLAAGPLLSQDPAELDLAFGVGGVARFDLGFDSTICDVEVVPDGATLLALGTAGGSEIWRVDGDGGDIEMLSSYPFAEASADCEYGILALACPESGTTCYGAGRRSLDGDDLTWLVAFDRNTGQPAGTPLPGGNSLLNLAPGESEGADAVAFASAAGADATVAGDGSRVRSSEAGGDSVFESSIVAVGGAGGLGFVATRNPGTTTTQINTVQISGEATEIERAWVEGNMLWVQGRTENYYFLCKYERQLPVQGGGWVPSSSFGEVVDPETGETGERNGCFKRDVSSLADFRVVGFKVLQETDADRPIVLVEREASSQQVLQWLVHDGNGEALGFSPGLGAGGLGDDVLQNPPPTLTCDPKTGRPVAQYRRASDGAVVLSPFEGGQTVIAADDYDSAQFLEALEGSGDEGALASTRSSTTPAADSASRQPMSSALAGGVPTEDTFVSIGRADDAPDAELVLVRVIAPSSDCEPDENTACLLGGKFRVEGTMKDFADPPNEVTTEVMTFAGGRAESDQAVFFESFSPGNFEAGVKMVDACGFPEGNPLRAYWAFFGGLTNAETSITILDTVTQETYEWFNPAGLFPQTVGDVGAFPCTPGEPQTQCARDEETACLIGGRFQVEGNMKDFSDPPVEFPTRVMSFSGDGRAESDQAVFFESFSPGNFEAGVKMVDACGFPEGNPLRAYWAFYGALTNAETGIRITQVATGEVDEWFNPAGAFPVSVGRLDAFPCEEEP